MISANSILLSIMKRIFLILFFSLLFTSVFAQQPKPDQRQKRVIMSFSNPEKMFQILEGKWVFVAKNCDDSYTVTVSPDKKTIKFTYAKPEMIDGEEKTDFTYKVLETGSYYIRARIEGEKRLTGDGKPVVWDFYFFSNDEFRWHRIDWKDFAVTPPVIRCKDKSNLVAQMH